MASMTIAEAPDRLRGPLSGPALLARQPKKKRPGTLGGAPGFEERNSGNIPRHAHPVNCEACRGRVFGKALLR